ncbi:MAG: acyl-CoA thioesterase [Opitutus sp.]|nr:acyl-CoA thioesterase [Opitutus sp.]
MDLPAHFHFSHRRMVEFSDTDLAGLMHFANFFRFVESAEHAFFRSLGLRVHTADGTAQQGWPRLEVSCQYHRPARFEQTLEICLRVEEVRTSSLRYGFWILAEGEKPRSALATGSFTIVHVALDTVSHTIRKAPIPAAVHAKLVRLAAPPPAST